MAQLAARSDPWRKAAAAAAVLFLQATIALTQAFGCDAAHQPGARWSFDVLPGAVDGLGLAFNLAPAGDDLGLDPMVDEELDWLIGDEVPPLPDL